MKKITLIILTFLSSLSVIRSQSNCTITSGVPWFDKKGQTVSAHGANIIKDNGRFYLFGECHTDTSNVFAGFNCYSSPDLVNWTFEKMVLPVQKSGKLGPNRVGERVKVLKCPQSGEYVMFMHADSITYKDQYVGYATSKQINGVYQFQGPLLFNGKPIRKWDMGVFQDTDGSGYIITHSGNLYKLSNDYKSVTEQIVKDMTPQCEAPAIFKKDSVYFWLGSYLSSWEKNDNYYFTATSLHGPWIPRGNFAPVGSLTWNSQTTYVLPIAGTCDTTFMFMGDRWSFPKQASAATYVWQPLIVKGNTISMPDYKQSWTVNTSTGTCQETEFGKHQIPSTDTRFIRYTGNWQHPTNSDTIRYSRSNEKGASFTVNFRGTQVGVFAQSAPNGGYAKVILKNKKGKIILSSIIDFYCKYPVNELKFLSPALPKNNYSLTVTVIREKGNWTDKRKSIYGSTDFFVTVDKIVYQD